MDKIIVLDHGKISEVGTYQELLNRGQDFARFLEEYANKQDEGIDEDEAECKKYNPGYDDYSVWNIMSRTISIIHILGLLGTVYS